MLEHGSSGIFYNKLQFVILQTIECILGLPLPISMLSLA